MAFVVGQGGVATVAFSIVALQNFVAQFRVRAFLFVVQGLADVMQQAATTTQLRIHAQIRRQRAGQESDFLRVLQDVLTVRGAILELTKGFDDLRVQA